MTTNVKALIDLFEEIEFRHPNIELTDKAKLLMAMTKDMTFTEEDIAEFIVAMG